MILVVDNYDSFVHNLGRYFQRLGQQTLVLRNDQLDAAEARRLKPDAVVLSPGPCAPAQAGCSLQIVRELHREVPILGVCLGHQAIAEALGGRIVRAAVPMHGRQSPVWHDGQGLFAGLPQPLAVGRYHSLVVEPQTLPPELEVSAWTDDRVIMALRHRQYPVFGVQFHPESILTECGYPLLAAFLRIIGQAVSVQLPDRDSELAPLVQHRTSLPPQPITF